MNTPLSPTCPKCGVALPIDAPKGLCPRCLAAMNLATETALTGAEAVVAPSPLTAAELAPHFPQLEILECLGRGGMGVVYKARQKTLNRLVALKLLAPERANNPSFAERFAKEAQALAALNHPNIVAIHDFGQAGGFYFLLMEFVDGVNLRQAMKGGRFTPEQAIAVVPPVCEALQYAHEHGIVHRDIKPENLLLDKDGRVKIADFGVAKMLEAGGAKADLEESQPAGTPQYMAPEQKEHRRTDHRADIYSLGVVLYEMLTGELPGKPLEPPSRRVQIDVRLDEVVLRALEWQPDRRYQTAAEVKTVLESMATHPPEKARADGTPGFLKSSNSTLTTPEQLATFAGQLFLSRTRGQLFLDDRQLTHARTGTNTVIPLAAIRDLSIGSYPRSMNPMGIDLLSLIYEEGGQRKQVLLSPMEGFFAFPATWNARVAEWFTAIREAVIATTDRAPGNTPAEGLGVPSGAKALYALYLLPLLPVLIGVTSIRLLTAPATGGGGGLWWRQFIPVMMLFILGGGVAAALGGHWFRRRNPGSSRPPGGAPAPEAWKHSVAGWRFAVLWLGLLSLATLVAVYVLFHRGAAPGPEGGGAISTVDPEKQKAPGGSNRSPKQFALEGFTNQLGYARVTTHTGFAPGESCQAWLVHADGRREELGSLESVFYHGGKESCICGWSWRLPPPFDTNRTDEVVAQLRERWQSRLLVCPPDQPVTLFTLTNEAGARVSGEVQFDRTEPDPTQTAVAEVRVRHQMGNLLFFTSKVPAGYALHIRGAGTESQSSDATLSRSASGSSQDEHCSWNWSDTEYRAALAATAAEQMRTLFAPGPLRVTNGRPRTVFSVTNTVGDVFAGQFELRGPAGATVTRPVAATPTWIARVFARRHKPASPGVSAAANLSPKPFALEGFTNQMGSAMVSTPALLAPGESCQAWLVHADGRREEANSLESVFRQGEKESGSCNWSWTLPPPFDTNRTDEVVAQLRERWQGRLLACPPGQPVTLFTLTNESGARVSGEVQFDRTEPDPAERAVAEVRVRNQMGNLLFFTSKVPAGHSLYLRAAGTRIQTAHATLSRSSSRYSTDETGSWMWTDQEYRPELSAAAAEQMRTLFAQGPLLVTNGQPRMVFSVTNDAGEVFAGEFELRGPVDATGTPSR